MRSPPVRGHSLQPVDVTHKDIAFLQYTGGTTGVSKGAMLTHGNMVANVLQASAWLGKGLEPGTETVITALPLYHIFSLTANCMVFMTLGGKNILITNPRDMKDFVKTLSKYPFSVVTGVNTLFNGLLHAQGFEQLDFSHLKLALGGGMAVQRAVAEHWKKVTGRPIVEAYGLTETSPAACINPLDLKDYNGSIGLPIPSTELSIRDDDGKELKVDEVGELCFKGPQVMAGYWNQPEETDKVLAKDGWLRTGDVGRVDKDGFVYIVDRKKDMILVSGFNVYPNEVEDVVMMHPGVRECAAVGVPDEHSGEAVKIFVVRKDPNLTAQELITHCHKYLTGYKVPKHVEFRTDLPKTNVGKILRRELTRTSIESRLSFHRHLRLRSRRPHRPQGGARAPAPGASPLSRRHRPPALRHQGPGDRLPLCGAGRVSSGGARHQAPDRRLQHGFGRRHAGSRQGVRAPAGHRCGGSGRRSGGESLPQRPYRGLGHREHRAGWRL